MSPLHIDYRPKSLDDVVGNEAEIASLKSIFGRKSDYPHAILFQGAKGCGKTTLARIVAEILLQKPYDKCLNDFVQLDGGDVNAAMVVKIKEAIRFMPQNAKCRLYLIDEAHMIGQGGDSSKNVPQNNMLTILEEAPAHVYFIFTTTDPERLLGTIRSRCQIFQVAPLRDKQLADLLGTVLLAEEYSDFPVDILKQIVQVSEGCPRDALKMLDKIIDMPAEQMSSAVQDLRVGDKNVADLCKGLLNNLSWKRLSSILDQMELNDHERIRRAITGWMTSEVRRSGNEKAAMIYSCFEKVFFDNGKNGVTMACHQAYILGQPEPGENTNTGTIGKAPDRKRLANVDDDIPF